MKHAAKPRKEQVESCHLNFCFSRNVWLKAPHLSSCEVSPAPTQKKQLYLKELRFEDNNVPILDREDKWFERGIRRKAIHIQINCYNVWVKGGET